MASQDVASSAVAPAKTDQPSVRKSHLLVLLGGLVAGISSAGAVLEGWNKIEIMTGWKSDTTLVLAAKNSEGEFLRTLTIAINRRLFWARRYHDEVRDSFPKEVLDKTWDKYDESVVSWK